MALSTWAELKLAVADWLWRTDLTSQIPDFITMAEARFNRELRTPDMVNSSDLTITSGVASVPTGFVSALSMTLTGQSPYNKISYQPADQLAALDPANTGTPRVYTRIGSNFEFWPPVSATAKLRYRKKVDALGASTASNWVLANHPDLYVFASLVAAEPFLRNDPRLAVWKTQADETILSINAAAQMEAEDGIQIIPSVQVI